jgi:hypothetical protein
VRGEDLLRVGVVGGTGVKAIRVTVRWESDHEVEVPDDYEWTGELDDVWADQVYPTSAWPVDWSTS